VEQVRRALPGPKKAQSARQPEKQV
jgi:hypothetical protein